MRLHRLEIEGFGPFRARQIVDFDAFADDGIFLIAGRTGAGKSSILDAVCFGLYGGVPRYESGDKRLRSDHCEPDDISEVVVEFSTSAGRFRVTRSPEYVRPAKRGGGLTKQPAAVALEEHTDAGWVGRAARAVDVGNELDGILQLNQQQFLQVILLAQNRFARFLLADSKERQGLLRRLFGTERFEDIQSRFDERRRASEHALGARLATVTARIEEAERIVDAEGLHGETGSADPGGPVEAAIDVTTDDGVAGQADASSSAAGVSRRAPETVAERLEELSRASARAQYRSERRAAERDDAERRLGAADAALTEIREQRRAQIERDRARAALAALDAEAPLIAEMRDMRDRARSAEALRSTITAAARAAAAGQQAVLVEQEAGEAWRRLGVPLDDESATALRSWASAHTRESGEWQRAAQLEAESDAREAELSAARDAVAARSARAEQVEQERRALPAQIETLTGDRDAARRLADRIDELVTRSEEASARRDAARDVERLESEQRLAEEELVALSARLDDAQRALTRLRQRRLDGFAGELASELADGAACPVCGSAEHPAPAVHADPVSADDITAAEGVRDEAAQQERSASERASTLRADLAVARTRADSLSVAEAEARLAETAAQREQAVDATTRLDDIERALQDLREREARLAQEQADNTRDLASARESLAVLEQQAADAARLIADARGDAASVAERLDEATARIAAASEWATAIDERTQRTAAVEESAAELADALAGSPFDDAGEAERALRTPSEQEAAEKRLTEHAVQREKERGILLDLELRTLPEEPIDVAPVEQAASEARADWVGAVDRASRAAGVAEQLGALLRSAESEHERSAELADRHDILRGLADTVAGRGPNTHRMTLETFVLAAELEEIVAAANRRLSDMSTGRYQLRHSDAVAARGAASGLGIVVFDAFTGQTRPAHSLSGGETFLSSLALALGLAEVVTARAGGIRLDTLFIDEGFGSLDADTLDIAMRTLDELRQGGRTVGVISHVEAMQEQIPAQLTVRATADGPSVITM